MKFDIKKPADTEVTITLTLREVRLIEGALDWATDSRRADKYDTVEDARDAANVWDELYLFLDSKA